MTKIILVTCVSDLNTGGGNHIFNLATGISQLTRDFAVICLSEGSLPEALRRNNVRVRVVPIRGKFDLSGYIRLRNALKDERPAVIHTHGERASVIANWLARSLNVPVIITTIHRLIDRSPYWSPLLQQVYRLLEDFMLKFATTNIIAVSNILRQHLIERGIPAGKLTTIYNGTRIFSTGELSVLQTHPQINALKTTLHLPAETVVLACAGMIVKAKGYQYLLEALPAILDHHPNTYIVIIGEGNDVERLKTIAASLSIPDRLKFAGKKTNIEEILAMADIFVFPSLWDAFGLVLVEAMQLEIPVVAANNSGPAEIITHADSGLLIPPGNSAALAEAVISLLKNPVLAKKMGQRGREIVMEKFSTTTMVNQTFALYSKLMSPNNDE